MACEMAQSQLWRLRNSAMCTRSSHAAKSGIVNIASPIGSTVTIAMLVA